MVAYEGPTALMQTLAAESAEKKTRRRRRSPDEPDRCPFSVVIDTREQAPFMFTGIETNAPHRPLDVLTVRQALPSGDYSIEGMEKRVAIERKSVSDWFGSIGGDRTRFEAEVERLSHYEYAAVVIEGGWQELLIDRPSNTQVPGIVSSRTIASWDIRYGVRFYPCMNRRHAELFTFALLSMFWRQDQRKKESLIDSAAEALVGSN